VGRSRAPKPWCPRLRQLQRGGPLNRNVRLQFVDQPHTDQSKAPPLALGLAFEVLFWLAIGAVWLTLSGGYVGAAIAVVAGGCVIFLWRAVVKRSRNPIQARESRSEWDR
jgi:hypothetical protein